jgi:hypothetical protein
MRPIYAAATLVAALAALPSAPAPGQPQQLTSTTTAPAPAQEIKPAATAKRRTWLKADARVCLEFPTDMQIVKCSEKYR